MLGFDAERRAAIERVGSPSKASLGGAVLFCAGALGAGVYTDHLYAGIAGAVLIGAAAAAGINHSARRAEALRAALESIVNPDLWFTIGITGFFCIDQRGLYLERDRAWFSFDAAEPSLVQNDTQLESLSYEEERHVLKLQLLARDERDRERREALVVPLPKDFSAASALKLAVDCNRRINAAR